MNKPRLDGIFPPLTTPFAENGTVAVDRLRANIEKYNAIGIRGFVALGSTGEAVMLTAEESDTVLKTVAGAAGTGKTLIAGTGAESTAETIARTNRAADLGYHAAMVRTPHYYRAMMTPDVQAEHYQRVADAAKIPVLVYSVPQFTGIAVEAPLIAILSKHQNIIGIKESSGDVRRMADMIAAARKDFQVVAGSAGTVYAALQAGAAGAVLAIADVLPELAVDMYEVAQQHDAVLAQGVQKRLLDAASVLVTRLGIPALKCGMDERGYAGGVARRPFLPLTEAEKQEVRTVLQAALARPGTGRSAESAGN
jgi:4-hydroxy-2-oxoglutarate aldolase